MIKFYKRIFCAYPTDNCCILKIDTEKQTMERVIINNSCNYCKGTLPRLSFPSDIQCLPSSYEEFCNFETIMMGVLENVS